MGTVAVLMEEYKTLREESLQAIQHQHSIVQFGVAALGVLLSLGANLKGSQGALSVSLVGVWLGAQPIQDALVEIRLATIVGAVVAVVAPVGWYLLTVWRFRLKLRKSRRTPQRG
jgi:4-amino-4-deoxy-L-arabinose transferase-like glycosyltransferase